MFVKSWCQLCFSLIWCRLQPPPPPPKKAGFFLFYQCETFLKWQFFVLFYFLMFNKLSWNQGQSSFRIYFHFSHTVLFSAGVGVSHTTIRWRRLSNQYLVMSGFFTCHTALSATTPVKQHGKRRKKNSPRPWPPTVSKCYKCLWDQQWVNLTLFSLDKDIWENGK